MKTKIADAFRRAKAEGRGAYVAYMTIGYPTLERSEAAVETLISEGADVIELGAPFSDPFADGAVIRSAAYEALRQGVTLEDVLALAARVRAVLAVDLPLEERDELLAVLKPRGISYIPLVAPNTPLERVVASAAGLENSFIYAITVKGTTGARRELPEGLLERLDAIRAAVSLPVAAGFGISSKEQADEICRHADGYVVGSALVKRFGNEA